jgi:penicillin-binding protein 2
MLDLAAHAVGYVGRINERELSEVDLNYYSGTSHIGKLGIEQYYKRALHSRPRLQYVKSTPKVIRCAS